MSTKECCRPRRGSNPQPLGLQSDVHPTEPPRLTVTDKCLLNQWKRWNDCRNNFITNLHKGYAVQLGFELVNTGSTISYATDWATEPGLICSDLFYEMQIYNKKVIYTSRDSDIYYSRSIQHFRWFHPSLQSFTRPRKTIVHLILFFCKENKNM